MRDLFYRIILLEKNSLHQNCNKLHAFSRTAFRSTFKLDWLLHGTLIPFWRRDFAMRSLATDGG